MQLDNLDISILRENFDDETISKIDIENISKIFKYLKENNIYYVNDLFISSLDLFLLSSNQFINQFEKLPGIGHKTAVRLAFYILESDENVAKEFSETLVKAKKNVKFCSICYNLTEKDPCDICSNSKRDWIRVWRN